MIEPRDMTASGAKLPTGIRAMSGWFCPLKGHSRPRRWMAGVTGNGHSSTGYSITSSAWTNSNCGTVRPSALAVFRLITSSSFVGSWTGRSAGFAPASIVRHSRRHGDRPRRGSVRS